MFSITIYCYCKLPEGNAYRPPAFAGYIPNCRHDGRTREDGDEGALGELRDGGTLIPISRIEGGPFQVGELVRTLPFMKIYFDIYVNPICI